MVIIAVPLSNAVNKERKEKEPLVRMTSNFNWFSEGRNDKISKKVSKMYQCRCKRHTMQIKKYSCARYIEFVRKPRGMYFLLMLHLRSAYVVLLQKRWLCTINFKEIPVSKECEKSCCPISAKVLKKMIKKFEETDSFEVKSGREKINWFYVSRIFGLSFIGRDKQWCATMKCMENF